MLFQGRRNAVAQMVARRKLAATNDNGLELAYRCAIRDRLKLARSTRQSAKRFDLRRCTTAESLQYRPEGQALDEG
ncbi:hypothetical protein [Streptomyces sp. G7(2002)]|uniref:hypothetical protein n=1 Tax=Streptomyces sp. G7(2002) TaxID=2971798 RepID=UPI00237EDCFA|nr:hypothetical protein [Streptomyces sp. G7(2002)]WDT53547.1 hypothetical protein NUT86_05520 [Streptomyces sp. G7(2002)]